MLAEARPGADVVAELEGAAELALVAETGGRDQVEADGAFHVGRNFREVALLQPEHRREPDVVDGAPVRAAPLAELHVPVAADMPVSHLEPLALPVPEDADAPHLGAVAGGFAELEGGAVAREGPALGIARIPGDGAEEEKRNRCG